jgi:uncharacterized tellurite resistance protein B-like protein
MLDFFSEQELTFEQVKSLTAGMYAVAKVDGVHDREMSLLRSFYESCTRAGDPRFERVLEGTFDVKAAAALFPGPSAKMFVKSLVLLAFADGQYGRAEDTLIREYASALGVTDVDPLIDSTREFLLGSLSHVQNVDALQKVAQKLEIK